MMLNFLCLSKNGSDAIKKNKRISFFCSSRKLFTVRKLIHNYEFKRSNDFNVYLNKNVYKYFIY